MKDMNALFGMVDHCNVETMAMRWRKCDLWKASIVVAGVLLLLVLMAWVPVSVAGAHEGVSGAATPGTVTVQATPTVDATVTALNKEKLQHENDWWWNYGATILTSLISTLTLAAAGVFTVVRYFNDRRDTREKQEAEAKRLAEDRKAEREKRAEERFQAAVEGLSSEREEAKIGAAILLRTFLRPGYEQFYTQTFDLAVANLRLARTSEPPKDPDAPLELTTLSQALLVVFKEAFPRAREWEEKQRTLESSFLQGREEEVDHRQYLDATEIQLDNAYLFHADLEQAWMPQASLRNADLGSAKLIGAKLIEADLYGAKLDGAELNRAQLSKVKNLENTFFEKDGLRADLRGVIGLTKEQLAACKAKGAIIDEDPATSSSQPPVTPPLSSQSNDTQVSSAPSAPANTPPPDTDGSSAVSSQQDSES